MPVDLVSGGCFVVSRRVLGGDGHTAQGRVEGGQISESMSTEVRVVGLAERRRGRVYPLRLRLCAGAVPGELTADIDEELAVRLRRFANRPI
jgi:hypothetical protein